MEICIDFDGTCVTHNFPLIGKEIGAVPVLKRLVETGHNLILFTMRSDIEASGGEYLTEAVEWFRKNEILLFGVNIDPNQISWTKSPKPYGQLYIDDVALGCPLMMNTDLSDRPFVNWVEVERLLVLKGVMNDLEK